MTIITYETGKSPSSYFHPDYIPTFMSPTLPNYEHAQQLCGNDDACIFDYAITLNENLAIATKDATTQYLQHIQMINCFDKV